jgi:hypothetical protein
MSKVTQKQAERILAALKERYAYDLEGVAEDSPDYPKLVKDWEPDWREGTVPYAILWPSGPFEWAYRFTMGGFDEEYALSVEEVAGPEKAREMAKAGRFTERPVELPKGVHLECGSSSTLTLYPA